MTHVSIIDMTQLDPDTKKEVVTDATNLMASAYIGKRCRYCHGEFTTLEDLRDVVIAGHHGYELLAHRSCFRANNLPRPEEQP